MRIAPAPQATPATGHSCHSAGYTGIHRHTQAYKCDSGMAVHSTNMQTNTEQFQIIHSHQFCNQPKSCA